MESLVDAGGEWLRTAWTVAAPLLAALALGAVIGWEREWRQKPAGLRTHMLVSLGAASFTLVTFSIYESVLAAGDGPSRVDPLRIVEGVIGGIGFLGAGAIIRDRGSVEGLTTAGTIWLSGSLGLACGSRHYTIAVISMALAIVALVVFGLFERRVMETK